MIESPFLIEAAAKGLGILITSLVKDKGGETLEKFDWDIGKNWASNQATKDYINRYIDRHGTLKVVCVRMDNPVRLDQVYTAVQLLDRPALRYFDSEQALQEQYRESGKRNFHVTQADKTPGLQVANEQQYLMVLGGPGVGKSTFLRKVGLESLLSLGKQETSYQHPCIPVMLELRQFEQPNRSIKAVIASELDTCGFPAAEELTELFLKNGKLLVLLDGLDEVPSATLNHAITEIENLVDRYSKNRYIASCRVAAYNFGGFRRFKDVAMAPFEDDQIQQFIQNWFQTERDTEINTANRCWELLNSQDYRAAKELAQTPLLLTLLCVVYDEYQDFPKKRHALYGEALDVLLRKWASEKRIQRNPIYQELSAELELDMLSEIAYSSFVEDQLFFSKQRLIDQIREFLINNLNAPKHLDAETVLKEIEIQQGILVERARDAYSFSHLTFQEYLTAKYIVDNRQIDQLVSEHVTEGQWQEVFLLVAGLSPGKEGADRLLLKMEEQAQSYVSPKLQAILHWATEATQNSPGIASAPAKRVAAITLILGLKFALAGARARARALNLDFASALARASASASVSALNLASALARASTSASASALARASASASALNLARKYQDLGVFNPGYIDKVITDINSLGKQIASKKDPGINLRDLELEILQIYSNNLGFDLELFSLSEQELKQIEHYFSVLKLMVCCKDAAVRVSPQTWADIESRMATVTNPASLA